MKKILGALILSILLTGCDDSVHVDMQAELRQHQKPTLSFEDGTMIEGFDGNFCTDVLCFEAPPVDFAALSYTPYTNGELLILTLPESNEDISSISLSTLDETGRKNHRDLPLTAESETRYIIDEAFPDDLTDFTLDVKINYVDQGDAHYLYPMHLQ